MFFILFLILNLPMEVVDVLFNCYGSVYNFVSIYNDETYDIDVFIVKCYNDMPIIFLMFGQKSLKEKE